MSYYSCDHVRGCVVTVQPTASMFSKYNTNDGIMNCQLNSSLILRGKMNGPFFLKILTKTRRV